MDPVPSPQPPDDRPPEELSGLADPTVRIPEVPGNVRAAQPAYLAPDAAEDARWLYRASRDTYADTEDVLDLRQDADLLDALQKAGRLRGAPAGSTPVSQRLQRLWDSTRVLAAAGQRAPDELRQRPAPPAHQEVPHAPAS